MKHTGEEEVALTYELISIEGMHAAIDTSYVRKCMAATDVTHYKLRGLPIPGFM